MKNKQTLSGEELSSFCSQIALVLGAGIPLYDGVESIATDSGLPLYKELSERVNETGSLYDAMKEDDRWPQYLREMTALGEKTGQLETVMQGLSEHYAREERGSSAVRSAIAYPLALGGMLVVIVLVILWKVLPVFQRVLGSMGIGMTETGNRLMAAGSVVGYVVLGLVAVVVVFALVCLVLMRTGAREKVLAFLYRLVPPISNVRRKLAASRVASVLSMLLSAGFPMEEGLDNLQDVLGDEEAERKVQGIKEKLEQGEPIADALSQSGLFDSLSGRMIRMGAAAGCEDQVMKKTAALYEEQVEESVSSMISIIEPSLVALLAVVIGAVLLSVMLPMAGMLSSMM